MGTLGGKGLNKLYSNSIEFPEMNYIHFREKNAKFHIFLLLSIMGGISLITIYDRKFRHNRPEEGLPKMITYISPINMVAEDNHLYFAYKSPLGMQQREVSAIHGCSKRKFLQSINAGKGNFCHPWMQQMEVSAIHGWIKGKFLLSIDAGKGNFCCPWMQQREVSAIH